MLEDQCKNIMVDAVDICTESEKQASDKTSIKEKYDVIADLDNSCFRSMVFAGTGLRQ